MDIKVIIILDLIRETSQRNDNFAQPHILP